MNSILIAIVFAFLIIPYQGETKPYRRAKKSYRSDEDLTADKASKFNCYLYRGCTPGGGKVCGFDEDIPWLVEFADLCTLYKTNCNSAGKFIQVGQIVCDTKIQYDKEHFNDTIVIHVRPTANTDRPVARAGATRKMPEVKLYYLLFAAFNCYLHRSCTPGGGWVCGVDETVHASFPDLCHLYGVNCKMQGVYWQIGTELCQPKIKWALKRTAYYGQKTGDYETERLLLRHKFQSIPQNESISTNKPSILKKIKDSLGISANYSIQF